MFSLKVSGYGPWFQTCLQPKYCNQSSPKQKCIYTIFTLQDRWNSKKCIFPRETLVFAAQILTQKTLLHLGVFWGGKNAEKRVQECQDWNYPGPRLSNPESIWHLSKVDLFFYLCIFVSFYFSIFLSIYLSVYLWQFDYLLTFDGSKQAAGHQISQNAVQDPKGHAFWICVCSKGICIFVKFWEIRFAWWNVINLRFTGFRSPKWSFHRWRIGCFRIWKFQAEAPKTINSSTRVMSTSFEVTGKYKSKRIQYTNSTEHGKIRQNRWCSLVFLLSDINHHKSSIPEAILPIHTPFWVNKGTVDSQCDHRCNEIKLNQAQSLKGPSRSSFSLSYSNLSFQAWSMPLVH